MTNPNGATPLGTKTRPPWTNVYGIARTLLALGTLISLAFHDVDVLFRPLGVEISAMAGNMALARLSIFSILSGERLETARWLSIVVLVLTASGWRPRVTGVLHWWVTFSFAVSCVLVEGGDQVAAIVTLLLVPVTLTDPRRLHWSAPPPAAAGLGGKVAALISLSTLLVIRLQVAAIYLVAGASKLGVEEWRNGTALYYWLLHPVFGVPDWRRGLLMPLLTDPALTTLMTWGAMGLELLLFMGLAIDRRHRPALLAAGIFFHTGIAVFHGLVTFSVAMIASLILYLRPAEHPLAFPRRPWSRLGVMGGAGRWLRRLHAGALAPRLAAPGRSAPRAWRRER